MVCQLNHIRVIQAPMINAPRVPIISKMMVIALILVLMMVRVLCQS